MIKLCVFDLDGTILNTLSSIAYFGNEALKKYGLKTFGKEEYKGFIGSGVDNLIKNLTKDNEAFFCKVKDEYKKSYKDNCSYLTTPYDGIIDLLLSLKEKGIILGILSNKPHEQVSVLYEKFLKDYMQFFYGGGMDFPLKPKPDMLFMIMEKYKINKDECIFIGDSEPDFELSKNAGVKSIGCLWGYRNEEVLKNSGATYIVKLPCEIEKIVFNI